VTVALAAPAEPVPPKIELFDPDTAPDHLLMPEHVPCWPLQERADLREQRVESGRLRAAWAEIYRDPDRHWPLYELAEKLVDLEDYFRRWRFNHVTTVERVIGLKRGTGGTQGVAYLRRMLEVELFPELWHVRTEL